ncbi:MAG: KamA family radical SAM protein [Myxococcales bacterium]|jgi:lysine 2,3-aminomutase|nr:KamA family radical SAM protein [Myxococcales bacterium]
MELIPLSEHAPWRAFDATEAEWCDWRWQQRHAIDTIDEVERFVQLTDDERAGITWSKTALPFRVTPYFLSLIDPLDPRCPLRRQVIPSAAEATRHPGEFGDPLGEDSHSPAPGLVHKYEGHVLLLATDRCASYCRHCTRRRLTGRGAGGAPSLDQAIDYIARHREIRDVLISGGDPLLLSDDALGALLDRLRAIEHVQILRIGTRVPAFNPMRVTPSLVERLRRAGPLFVVTHFNHARELAPDAIAACARLVDAGIPLDNQTVLLRSINSEAGVLKALFEKLLRARVRPYYLHQLDLAQGTEHFRTPLRTGVDILKALRGHTSGLAIPQLAVDLPGGFGKVTLGPDFVASTSAQATFFRNWQGALCPLPYPEPAQTDCACSGERRVVDEADLAAERGDEDLA